MLKFLHLFLFLGVFALSHSMEIRTHISGPDYEYLCESKTIITFPQNGETKDSKSMVIVNTDEYKQAVEAEVCLNAEQPCNYIADILPNGIISVCKQNYVYRSLKAVTSNGTITQEHFKIPSACKCAIIRRI